MSGQEQPVAIIIVTGALLMTFSTTLLIIGWNNIEAPFSCIMKILRQAATCCEQESRGGTLVIRAFVLGLSSGQRTTPIGTVTHSGLTTWKVFHAATLYFRQYSSKHCLQTYLNRSTCRPIESVRNLHGITGARVSKCSSSHKAIPLP